MSNVGKVSVQQGAMYRSTTKKAKFNSWPYIFVTPYFLVYIAFGLFPILFSFYISFMSWDGITEMRFVGLKNYIQLAQDKVFLKSLLNVAIIMIGYIPLQLICGLLLAAVIYSGHLRMKRFFQLVFFLPYITTPVAVGLIFALFFDWQSGFVNRFFIETGLWEQGVNWLGQPATARLTIIFMLFWKGFGYCMLIYLAGISSISKEIYEAASIDGAKPIQSFFHITIPLVKPVTLFLLITSVIYGFQLLEEPMLLLAGWASGSPLIGGPDRCCFTPIWYLYDSTFSTHNRLGYGSSIAYGLFIIILAFSIIGIKLISGRNKNDA